MRFKRANIKNGHNLADCTAEEVISIIAGVLSRVIIGVDHTADIKTFGIAPLFQNLNGGDHAGGIPLLITDEKGDHVAFETVGVLCELFQ